ncbi:MAG: mandelate racemase, partial [Chloroflexi bacterium]|nr:mandelate racemase [Chloroflexota bacterium]
MGARPAITSIEVIEYSYKLHELGTDYNGFNLVHVPGSTLTRTNTLVLVHTDQGLTGHCLSSSANVATLPMFADYLIGQNAFEREKINQDVKRALRQIARVGLSVIDVALWDIAGQYYDAPIWELLGGHVRPLKCYASTTHGDHNGGLSSPEAYADYAELCLGKGYPAFKIHGWGDSQVALEVAT